MFALVKNEVVTNPVTQETSEVEVIKLFPPYTLFEDKFGTQHSPETLNNWTTDQKQDHGIYDVAYSVRKDDRFYKITEDAPSFDSNEKVVKVTFTSIPKDLEDSEEVDGVSSKGLKSQWISAFKNSANSMLAATDWMLVRKIERDVDIPAEVTSQRAAIVAETNRLETAIAAATTVEGLISVVESANFAA